MKKTLLIASIALLASCSAVAQNNVITMTHSGDTATQAVSKHVDYNVTKLYKSVSIQSKLTKISGTVAGYSVLKGSLDNTNFVDISTDSLLATNVTTNTKIWVVDNSPYPFYRVTTVGTGTMSVKCYGYLLANNPGGTTHGVMNLLSVYSKTSDTVTNAATNYVQIQAKYGYNSLTIQPVVTKISGTAAGTVTLQGSNDGVNYVTVNTSYIAGASATMTVTNVTTSTRLFVVTGSPYEYYRLSYTGSGTMSCSLKGYLVGK